jgi:hypothetical protein
LSDAELEIEISSVAELELLESFLEQEIMIVKPIHENNKAKKIIFILNSLLFA